MTDHPTAQGDPSGVIVLARVGFRPIDDPWGHQNETGDKIPFCHLDSGIPFRLSFRKKIKMSSLSFRKFKIFERLCNSEKNHGKKYKHLKTKYMK